MKVMKLFLKVEFPDFDCYTFGETIEEAYNNAEDVLNLVLYVKKNKREKYPKQVL